MSAAPGAGRGHTGRAGRPRNAAASAEALLAAAQELFGQKGFERTTLREVGERAGVDAALVARYFGSKADLYVAAVVAEATDDPSPVAFESLEQIASTLVARTDRHGPGPILQALIRADTSEEIREAAKARLHRRVVQPLMADGTGRSRLEAELVIAALVGVSLGRSLGWFEELGRAPADEVVDLIAVALSRLSDR